MVPPLYLLHVCFMGKARPIKEQETRYKEENNKLLMPITVRLNHAIADGFLVANVFKLLEKEMELFIK